MNTIDWLINSDPAIRWQAMRDLTDASPASVHAERARVLREGLGSRILAAQQADGAWRRDGVPDWLPTLFSLLLLRATGIDPAEPAVESAVERLLAGLRWNDNGGCWNLRAANTGGATFFDGEEEPCINGGVLALSGYFGHPSESLAHRLVSEQLEDGGWNCEAPKSARSSFHSTICVLEGLQEYELAAGKSPGIAEAKHRGEEYLLQRHLFRRRSTGEIIDRQFLELAFPPRYRYDILRALDYFRAGGAQPDPRMNEAVQFIESRQQPDGRWLLDRAYDESLPFPLSESAGQSSGWNTVRALRVLRWYHHLTT